MPKPPVNAARRARDRLRVISDPDQRLIRLHVDYIRRTGDSAKTQKQRRDNLRRLAHSLPVPLLDAKPEHLEIWQSRLGVSLSSIATYSSHVRSFYRWAVDVGHLDADPAHRLARTRVPARAPRPIPRADFEMALECAQDPIYTWLVLGAFMGLRAHEVAQIAREDITEGIVGGKRRTFLSGVGKGAKPFKLPVPIDVLPILQRHITSRPGALWRNKHHNPVTADNVTDNVSAFFRGLGMPYTMHQTRHTYGTELQQKTQDILATKTLMRHSSVQTTLLYVQTADGAGVAAMDRLSARLSRIGAEDDLSPRRRRAV